MTDAPDSAPHIPILLDTVVELLAVHAGRYVDGTVGAGGHAAAIVGAHPLAELIGIDRDERALRLAGKRLAADARRVRLVHGTFDCLGELVREAGWQEVDGILLDVGLSSMQIDDPARGFTYREDGPLDMRMDRRSPVTASSIVNGASEEELTRIFREYGEERRGKRVAQAIVRRRRERPLERTRELAELVRDTLGVNRRSLPPEALIFQALRIAVNGELEQLESALDQAHELLAIGGRLVVISFHSLEDRIVKHRFRHWANDCVCPPGLPICACDKQVTVRELTRKPLTPDESEISRNRRAASAKLRCCEKLAAASQGETP